MNQDEVDTVLGIFEDSDYSAHVELQDLGRGTMIAAGHLLRENNIEFRPDTLKRAALAFYGYSADENEFASSEDAHLMKLCSKRRFTSFLMDEIAKQITAQKIHEFGKRGWFVVKLRYRHAGVTDNEEGIYVFTDEAIAK